MRADPSNKLSRASAYRTGSATSPMTPNLNGQHMKCKCVLTSFRKPVSLRLSAGTSGYRSLRPAVEDMSMNSPTWRGLGQVVLVYFAISGSAVTAQDQQPGRATFAEMVAFARLASVPCKRLAPDVEGFHALVLQRLIKPPLTQEEIAAKEKDVTRLRHRLGLSRWCKRFAGEMEQARIFVQVLRRQN
jgi:hypothetical protein